LNSTLAQRDDLKIKSIRFLETNHPEVLAFIRYDRKNKFLVLINNSNKMIKDLSFENFNQKNKSGLVIFALNEFTSRNKKLNYGIYLNNIKLKSREALIIKLVN